MIISKATCDYLEYALHLEHGFEWDSWTRSPEEAAVHWGALDEGLITPVRRPGGSVYYCVTEAGVAALAAAGRRVSLRFSTMVRLLTRDQIHALGDALTQYVENSVDEADRSPDDKRRVEAAQGMLDVVDAVMASAAEP